MTRNKTIRFLTKTGFLLIFTTGGLVVPVRSQVYIPFYYTNSLSSSSGASSLLGVSLGSNTILQGYLYVDGLDGSAGPTSACPVMIQFLLSDGINSYFTSGPTQSVGYVLSAWQSVSSDTLTITSGATALPWGGNFEAVFSLPSSYFGATVNDTLDNLTPKGKGNNGPVYGQYSCVISLSDGSATGIFGAASVPEPDFLSLFCLCGGLLALFFKLRSSSIPQKKGIEASCRNMPERH